MSILFHHVNSVSQCQFCFSVHLSIKTENCHANIMGSETTFVGKWTSFLSKTMFLLSDVCCHCAVRIVIFPLWLRDVCCHCTVRIVIFPWWLRDVCCHCAVRIVIFPLWLRDVCCHCAVRIVIFPLCLSFCGFYIHINFLWVLLPQWMLSLILWFM